MTAINWCLNFLTAAILTGTTLTYGTLGEILTEKSGNMNLGVEGIMYLGGSFGLISAWCYEQSTTSPVPAVATIIAIIVAFIVGGLGSAIYSFLTISLRANQNVTGLALTIFGVGFAEFFAEFFRQRAGGRLMISAETDTIFTTNLFPKALSDIPIIGQLLFSYNFMIYASILLACAMFYIFNRTRVGLNLRAVGEAPATADAAGISVTKYKYIATIVGGGICGLGGLYFTMVTSSGNWSAGAMDGKGWLAVALVIFALWKPFRAVFGSILFGALSIMYMRVTFIGIPTEIYKILPYIVTVIVLIVASIRQKRENQPPASLGIPYFREER